jgi:streptogramin lyase
MRTAALVRSSLAAALLPILSTAGVSASGRPIVVRTSAMPDVHFVRYIRDTGIDGDLNDIALGPDGALWFTEFTSDAIGRVDKNGNVLNFPTPPNAGNPDGITAGPDGNIWFTLDEGQQQAIGRITRTGLITIFPFVGTQYGMEVGITAGPDGNVYFSDTSNNKIGRITPQGVITEFPIPKIGEPWGLTTGPDHNLWICEFGALQGSNNETGRILRMTTAGKFTAFPLSPPSWTTNPEYITTGPDNNLWFTEYDQTSTPYNVERITTTGLITEYALPKASNQPREIATGADGNLWVTEPLTYIDRVTPTGSIERFAMPKPPGTSLPAQPVGITSGPLRDLWWIETSTGSVGVLDPFCESCPARRSPR